MPYAPQTWVDGSGGGTPVSAARLGYMETGIQNAMATAEAAVPKSLVDAKGDLIVATAADTVSRLAIGADDTVAVAAAAEATGIKWVKVGNAMIATTAAIAYSKLNLAGSIVNADIHSAAAIALSKLGQGGATTGQAVVWNGTEWAPANVPTTVQVLTQSVTDQTVTNSTAEASFFSYSVPGNTLGTNKMIRVTIMGEYAYAVGNSITLRFKYGATTISAVSGISAANVNAATKGWVLRVYLVAKNATNSQKGWWKGDGGEAEKASDEQGSFEHNEEFSMHGMGTATEDSTAAKTLDFTAQWSAASASLVWTKNYAVVELVG